jgi:hypothetical protein
VVSAESAAWSVVKKNSLAKHNTLVTQYLGSILMDKLRLGVFRYESRDTSLKQNGTYKDQRENLKTGVELGVLNRHKAPCPP